MTSKKMNSSSSAKTGQSHARNCRPKHLFPPNNAAKHFWKVERLVWNRWLETYAIWLFKTVSSERHLACLEDFGKKNDVSKLSVRKKEREKAPMVTSNVKNDFGDLNLVGLAGDEPLSPSEIINLVASMLQSHRCDIYARYVAFGTLTKENCWGKYKIVSQNIIIFPNVDVIHPRWICFDISNKLIIFIFFIIFKTVCQSKFWLFFCILFTNISIIEKTSDVKET